MAQNPRPYNQNRQESGVALYTANDVMVPEGFKENVELIIQTYAKDLSPGQFSLFLADAHSRGMSITKRQIYATVIKGKMTIMVAIDGYRSTAEDHPDYAGQDGPYWCGTDGVWRDVWLSKERPAAAKVGVFRKGFQAPVYSIALWSEYAKPDRDTWKYLPTVMLAKCAEAQAIRRAFPAKLGGTYIPEEMDQARSIETTGRMVSVAPTPMVAEDVDQDTGEIEEKERDAEWYRARTALRNWADKIGMDDTDLYYSAQALFSKRQLTSFQDLSATDLRTFRDKLMKAYDKDPAKFTQWIVDITPPSETTEVIEAEGQQLPGMDDIEDVPSRERVAEAARA